MMLLHREDRTRRKAEGLGGGGGGGGGGSARRWKTQARAECVWESARVGGEPVVPKLVSSGHWDRVAETVVRVSCVPVLARSSRCSGSTNHRLSLSH